MGFLLKRGLPFLAVVVVAAWAVFAVVSLSGTLISTHQIIDSVAEINTVYPRVDKNLKSVPLALETARVSGEIDKATKPVGPAFTQIVDAVNGIQASAAGILQAGGEINTSAKSINAGVKSINAVAVPIGASLASVDDRVRSIRDSAHGIKDKFDDILDNSHSINDRVRGINNRAETIHDVGKGIRSDLDLATDTVLPHLLTNAIAIKNSPVLQIPTVQGLLDALGLTAFPTALPNLALPLSGTHGLPSPALAGGPQGLDLPDSPMFGGHTRDNSPRISGHPPSLGGLLGG